MTPDYEFCKRDLLSFVYEKEDLLVDHGGKDNTYNYYRHAGVKVYGDKGEHINENKPVDVTSNLP